MYIPQSLIYLGFARTYVITIPAQGHDLIHSSSSPVRVLEYRVKYGEEMHNIAEKTTLHHQHETSSEHLDMHKIPETIKRGGIGTTLRGLVNFTSAAESHKGLCHGGAMCSVFDDIIGWTAFCVTGVCIPWSGYTVEVNTRLMKPVPLGSLLELSCTVTKVERRKVYLHATLMKHRALHMNEDHGFLYASADGLVILNKEHARM